MIQASFGFRPHEPLFLFNESFNGGVWVEYIGFLSGDGIQLILSYINSGVIFTLSFEDINRLVRSAQIGSKVLSRHVKDTIICNGGEIKKRRRGEDRW